jgi:hypothetical protein
METYGIKYVVIKQTQQQTKTTIMSYKQNNPLSRKSSPLNEWGGNKGDYKRRNVDGVEKKIGDVGGHYKDYEGVSRQPSGGNKGDEKKSVRDYEGPSRQPYGGNEGDESRSKRDYEGMSRKSSSPLNNAGNIYGGWKSSRELTDMPLTKDMTSRDESPVNFMGINPEHKGYCTPMTKSTCTPHRKALARRLKPGGDLYRGKKKK